MCNLEEKIGNGKYGEIFSDKNHNYVIKVTKELEMSEVNILFNFKSKYLNSAVAIYDKDECNGKYAIKLNKLTGIITNMETPEYDEKSFNERYQIIKKLFRDYLLGLKCLHDNNYLHLDIQPGNLMYTGDINDLSSLSGQLIDFGFSRKIINNDSPFESSSHLYIPYNRPYENYFGNEYLYSNKSDIWSLGIELFLCLSYGDIFDKKFYKQLTGRSFNEENPDESIKTLLKLYFNQKNIDSVYKKFLEDEIYDEEEKLYEVREVLNGMLNINQYERMDVDQLLKLDFFKSDVEINKCSLVDSMIVNYNKTSLSSKYYGLCHIILFYKNELSNNHVVFLLKSIDLYMRTINLIDELSFDNAKVIAEACINIINNIYKNDGMIISKESDEKQYFILRLVNFEIERKYLYEGCKDYNELLDVYKLINLPLEYIEIDTLEIDELFKKYYNLPIRNYYMNNIEVKYTIEGFFNDLNKM